VPLYLLLSLVHPPPPSYDAGLLYGRGCPAYETVWNQHGCGGCLAFATATAYGMRSCKVALLVLWAFCGRVEAEQWIQAGRTDMPSPYAIMNCGEKLFGHGCESGYQQLTRNLLVLWIVFDSAVTHNMQYHRVYIGFDHDARGTSPPIHILSVTNLQTEHMSRFWTRTRRHLSSASAARLGRFAGTC